MVSGRDIQIFGIYVPTGDSDINTEGSFFDRVSKEFNKTENKQEIILLDHLNGTVGKARGNKIIGQYKEDVVTENGKR